MCTLSFVPNERGYFVAMNRDELLSRAIAYPPQLHRFGSTSAVYPHEPEGGTWLASNEYGVTLALLNWNDAAKKLDGEKQRSRGLVIPTLIASSGASEVNEALRSQPLSGTLPFCLVGVFPRESEVREWRWDGKRLAQTRHSWDRRHWFSSSRSDETAATRRGATVDAARNDADASSLAWLRRLHRSHQPEPGPFSVCVHRGDAATVSYSEIACGPAELEFSYQPGQPCAGTVFAKPVALRLAATIGAA
jgi:hypothetical protein